MLSQNGSSRPIERSRQQVMQARAQVRSGAESVGVDARFIDLLVETFYGAVREDDLIGPIFAAKITDWPVHLERMKGFWRSILHRTAEFSGNPMEKHLAIPGLEERHFERWLHLFYATLRKLAPEAAKEEATRLVGDRARMIADSLLTGIEMRRDGIAGARAGKDLPHA